MRITLYIVCFFMMWGCKEQEEKESPATVAVKKNIPAFAPEWQQKKIRDITLQSPVDTINYALGAAWAHNMGRIGMHRIAPAFYLGVFDQFAQNSSFINAQEASTRLDNELMNIPKEHFPVLSEDQLLGNISIQSVYDTISYELGYLWASGAKKYGIASVTPALLLGLEHGLKGDTSLFTYEKADKYLRGYVEQKRVAVYASGKSENEQWLKNNSTLPGITILPSGLQYRIIHSGKGRTISQQDVVSCNYTARLINNTVFESSESGTPLRLYPRSVVKGWTEALLQMKEGDKWELYIPYQLGYGFDGIPGKVPPFATLIYDVEVVRVGS
ncbi:MAG: FKBP-type peptidyl-prolyl cis-trans isomerase [Chitinophagaceae bacterium]